MLLAEYHLLCRLFFASFVSFPSTLMLFPRHANMPWTAPECRVAAFVKMMNASTKAYTQFRGIQQEAIRRDATPEERALVEEEDAASVSAEEVSDDEPPETADPGPDEEEGGHPLEEEDRPLKRVLQLVSPVETRWNSTFYMLQR